MIPSSEAWAEQSRRHRLLRYGVDIQVEIHPTREVIRDGRHFPAYVVSWRTDSGRHSMLLEPVLTQVRRRGLWPFIRSRLVWEVDDVATEAYLQARIRTTTRKPVPARWPFMQRSTP
jgi:hypothetical protein